MDKESIDPNLLKRMMMGEFSSFSAGEKSKSSNSKIKKIELDLHFEKIAPEKSHLSSSEKHRIQLDTLDNFIVDAKKQGIRSAYVIVGKGEGVLKSSVVKLLNSKDILNTIVYDPPYFGNALKVTL